MQNSRLSRLEDDDGSRRSAEGSTWYDDSMSWTTFLLPTLSLSSPRFFSFFLAPLCAPHAGCGYVTSRSGAGMVEVSEIGCGTSVWGETSKGFGSSYTEPILSQVRDGGHELRSIDKAAGVQRAGGRRRQLHRHL
eukprot:765202-Hanusia_phi.AAC.2